MATFVEIQSRKQQQMFEDAAKQEQSEPTAPTLTANEQSSVSDINSTSSLLTKNLDNSTSIDTPVTIPSISAT